MAAARLAVVSGPRVVRALAKAGFVLDRIVGSHHVLKYPGDPTRTVVVPCHSGRDLKPGTLRPIIRRAGLTIEEFSALLQIIFSLPFRLVPPPQVIVGRPACGGEGTPLRSRGSPRTFAVSPAQLVV